ncbi:o-succinylbenzoate synthase [Nesterenkonia alkaliphila]|uniref:o-succinylbenzoate synthase n=1 Tax=Nesterenkonia alkaliphila TaxID=1463631 RepID=A0A7K1UFX2_9MICC|nr:o-succinylbenzoate synthase [Nesterenkonia alkaliphila]MVT25276.1 o-succinylbenzoate synthase [Nesterenkonia alkaliphila]GFZ91693.1 o-succinylbenzoate synthase [Nesterenkonia alkaliphila]
MNALPSLEEVLEAAVVVSLPMRTRFRGQHAREVTLLRGPAGWAEFGPFAEYGPAESAHWLRAGLHAGWTGLGSPLRRSVPVNATMPAVGPDQVETVLSRYGDPDSIPAVKIKVAEPGQSLEHDAARVTEVCRLAPAAGIRVDANGAWDIPQAVRALGQIAEIAGGRFEYAEQPVAGIEPLAQLREQLHAAGAPVPIAADEAVRKAEDPLRVARLGAADLIVVKAPPLGGVDRALEIVEQAGLPAVVSSALDTSVGLTAGVALAARLPELPYACGLGTVTLFRGELVAQPLVPTGGMIQVPVAETEGGVVVRSPIPDPQLISDHRVTGDREAWWLERLRCAYHVLHGS